MAGSFGPKLPRLLQVALPQEETVLRSQKDGALGKNVASGERGGQRKKGEKERAKQF